MSRRYFPYRRNSQKAKEILGAGYTFVNGIVRDSPAAECVGFPGKTVAFGDVEFLQVFDGIFLRATTKFDGTGVAFEIFRDGLSRKVSLRC